MAKKHPITPLVTLTLKVHTLLNRHQIPYLVIGGLAVGVVGEPRFTQDIYIDLHVEEQDIPALLDAATHTGLSGSKKKIMSSIRSTGTFSIEEGGTHVDFILASTPLEMEALRRRKIHKLFGKAMPFPTPEDLILLKLVPGRTSDLADIESIISRHRKKLDMAYLEKWARKLSEEQESPRIWGTLRKLMQEGGK